MNRVLLCITGEHDLPLVALALLVCLIGSAATMQLFGRIRLASGVARAGWVVLAAVATGTTVWCTHFVAMMAFRSHAPVSLDPLLTLASLGVAILLAAPGLALAAHNRRHAGALGGALIGMSISAMHYLGMTAYRIDGIVVWDLRYVAASIVLSSLLGAAAFGTLRRAARRDHLRAGLLFALAIATLHFTGMASMRIAVLALHGGEGLSDLTQTVLAIATAAACMLVVGCAVVSALVDTHTHGESYKRMRRMALHDGLTDLPNRLSYQEELARRLAMTGGASNLAVVMLDLSRFKGVNDTYGHQAGDQLLIALAVRLTALLRPGECIARLGGDEFAGLVPYDDAAELDEFLSRLIGAFDAPFVFQRFTTTVGVNVGVARAPIDGDDADTLLGRADLAMYRAKSARSGEPCFYSAAMEKAIRDRRELESDLRAAIGGNAFELHYQVQASIEGARITGYEALVRWRHPTRGMVPPSDFIPVAEQIGEIVPLSVWILRQACFEAALWPNRHTVSVNLSPLHLSDPLLVDTVRQALADSGLPVERLVLELTESAIIHDRRYALEQLSALKAMGVALALDDFGVGYSSLDVLRSFPFDRIKLDGSFVSEIEHDPQAVSILRSVAALGRTLGMPVLAEGIEEPAQLAIVAREGCTAIQGYLIGKPSRTPADPAAVRHAMALAPALRPVPIAAVA